MKNLKISLLFFLIFTSFTQFVFGQTKGFAFLKQVMPARAVAMGGALHAIKNDPGAIGSNPAALAGITERMSTFSYVNYILDVNGGEGIYIHPRENGNIAGSFYYQDYGSFDERDELNESRGTFSASSIILKLAYASQYKASLWYGVSAKYFRSEIADYSSGGFALDAAIFYQSPLLRNLNIGLGVYNIGTVQSAYIETKDEIPTSIELGLSKVLAHLPLEWSVAFKQYIDEDFVVALGGEFTVNENMFLRFGYNSNGQDQKVTFDKNRLAGFTTGVGLHFGKYTIDYAMASMGGLGTVNQFTLGMKF